MRCRAFTGIDLSGTPPTARYKGAEVLVVRWCVVASIAIAAVYVFWDVTRPFNQTDEFLYAGVVEGMLESGDYVTPRFGPIDLFTKPPLYYWLSAPLVAATGSLQIGMRLLPGLAFLALLYLIHRTCVLRFSASTGLMAMLAFLLCYDHLYNHAYKAGVMEGLLNLQMGLVLWLNLQLREHPGRIRWIGAIVGLAVMTKSAFAVIPAALTIAHLVLSRRELAVTRSHLLQSLALFLAVTLPWFVAIIVVHGMPALEYMFVDQVWKRFVRDGIAATETGRSFGRTEPLYVLRHFLSYAQPWSLLIWPALAHGLRRSDERSVEQTLLLRLCAGWFLGVFVLFLVSQGRWSWYVSSAYIPAAILIGVLLERFLRRADLREGRWVWVLTGAAFLASRPLLLFDPYSTSSGGFPVQGNLLLQMGVVAVVGVAASLVWRRARESRVSSDAARKGAVSTVGLALVVVAIYLRLFDEGTRLNVVTVVTIVGCSVMSIGLLALSRARVHIEARVACLACLVILAVGFLIAPLREAGSESVRWEIAVVRDHIASGRFEQEPEMRIGRASLFNFIPVYATFYKDYAVSYDAGTKVIRVRHEPTGEP